MTKKIDLSELQTPADLINFIFGGTVTPCEKCGWSRQDFEKTGRFGCPHCYDHFNREVEEIVFPYHQARHHLGKEPKRKSPKDALNHLKLKLAQAIELEKYEEAIAIKNEINALEQSLP